MAAAKTPMAPMAQTAPNPPKSGGDDWLGALEESVRQATARLGELREENRALTQRVQELESQLAAAQATPATLENAGAEAWEAEREEIRRRVEKLTLGLEALIES